MKPRAFQTAEMSLLLLLQNRFPFDSNNPIGYLAVIAVEYPIFSLQMFVIACCMALGIGAFWFAISATKDIQRGLHLVNKIAQTCEDRSDELLAQFPEYLDAYSVLKQLSKFQAGILTHFS